MRVLFFYMIVSVITILLILIIILAVIPFLNFTSISSKIISQRNPILIIGHRGASGYAPENTLASFQKALDIGVDMIELDVHLSADDSVMVIHDEDVSRTTNGKGQINDQTYLQLKRLDAGSWFEPCFKKERIPTLSEALALIDGKCKVLIELKWPQKGVYKTLVNNVINIVKQHNAELWVIIQSFESVYLKEAQLMAPSIKRNQLIIGQSQILPVYFGRKLHLGFFKPQFGISGVNPFYTHLNLKNIESLHRQNITVFTYIINDSIKMSKAINLGVDGIITDYPDIALKLLKSKR